METSAGVQPGEEKFPFRNATCLQIYAHTHTQMDHGLTTGPSLSLIVLNWFHLIIEAFPPAVRGEGGGTEEGGRGGELLKNSY